MGARVKYVDYETRRRQRESIAGVTSYGAFDDDVAEIRLIAPQPGPQTEFMATEADVAIYGGAAGGGKTYALLTEPLRHHNVPGFRAVIFRRNTTQVRNPGGLWDESLTVYPLLDAHPKEYQLEWEFPDGLEVKFAHLENDNAVHDWQGSQVAFIGFDELTHFSERQFFYMLSRNRSGTGVRGYVRATCNPDVDSWVRKLIDWYIGEDGYPIKDRAGKLRWFIRIEDTLLWADSIDELEWAHGVDQVYAEDGTLLAKSFTFIPSSVHDNKILMQKDPSYLANLRSLPRVERLRLLGGNWNVRATAGTMFRREWFPVLKAVPHGWTRCLRYWDRAATKPNSENKDPDWTRGVKIYSYPNGTFLIGDIRSIRDTPGQVEQFIKTVASHDGTGVEIMAQTDPGSAGKAEAEYFVRSLRGYVVSTEILTRDKVTRSKPLSAQAEVGNVFVLESTGELGWNEAFFSEMENFPDGAHDDIVDASSGAFNALCGVDTFTKAV